MSDRARVLNCLRLAGTAGVHSLDLRRNGITGNPSERVRELRALGFTIEAIPERQNGRNGRRYVLHAEPADAAGDGGNHDSIRFSPSTVARSAGESGEVIENPSGASALNEADRGISALPGAPSPRPAGVTPGSSPAPAGQLFEMRDEPKSAVLHDHEEAA